MNYIGYFSETIQINLPITNSYKIDFFLKSDPDYLKRNNWTNSDNQNTSIDYLLLILLSIISLILYKTNKNILED